MQSVLITGGSGSFGTAMARRLLADDRVERVAIYSRGEEKQVQMQRYFATHPAAAKLRFFIGDVRDAQRLETAMHGVTHVIHAAALKHVPVAEYNPTECVATNVDGTSNVICAAIREGVKKVVGLSTDKAVAPVNLYGATKLVAEKLLVAANNMSGRYGPRFSVVRYGNVVGSSGSVIPLFKRQAANGERLTITDKRMTRFWITMEQALDLVQLAINVMEGGEVLVPQIPASSIYDLAQAIDPSHPPIILGIRPGEKMHETLISAEETARTTMANGCYAIWPEISFWDRPAIKPSGAISHSAFTSDTARRLTVAELKEMV